MADPATFTAVDLSRLPAPALIETLSFEAIYAELLAGLRAALPDFDATVESEPLVKLLQVYAYRELLLRGRVNDAARAVMVAYAVRSDLDQLGALMGVARKILAAADPDTATPEILEGDDDFRRRIILAPEGFSVAGPEGAYIFHALGAAPDILDASAISPAPGEVVVTILSRTGNGAASEPLVAIAEAYLSDEQRRPLTDFVTVQSVQIIDYAVDAAISTFAGPDSAIVLAQARAGLAAYQLRSHRLGRDITRSGLIAALCVEGVHNVTLNSPAADLILDRTQAAHCTTAIVAHVGVGE